MIVTGSVTQSFGFAATVGPATLMDLLKGLRMWMVPIGRPVGVIELPNTTDPDFTFLPALTISPVGRSDPDEWTLERVFARNVAVEFTSIGRSFADASWLDRKVMQLVSGPLPSGLPARICHMVPESAASLSVSREGRMLVTHRVALTYR